MTISSTLEITAVKGKLATKNLSSYLKESTKQLLEVFYRTFTSSLFGEIFWSEMLGCSPSWIFVDMHDTSQVGSHDFIF